MTQTGEELIDHVSDNGVYLCEDLHTSYWKKWGGKLRNRNTFIEYRNGMINISPIGRACNQTEREEFEAYDNKHNIRKHMIYICYTSYER